MSLKLIVNPPSHLKPKPFTAVFTENEHASIVLDHGIVVTDDSLRSDGLPKNVFLTRVLELSVDKGVYTLVFEGEWYFDEVREKFLVSSLS